MRFGKKEVAGSAFVAGGVILFGKETMLWAYGKLLDTISTAAPAMSWTTFPWQNATAAVLTIVGVGLLLWPRPRKRKKTRKERLFSLHLKADDFVSRVRHNRKLEFWERDHAEDIVDLARDGLSSLEFFKKEGLTTPDIRSDNAANICIGLEAYFSALNSILRDGHLDKVESHSKGAAAYAEKEGASFNPQSWIIEQY